MTTIDKIRAEIKILQDIFVKTAEELETEDEATVYSTCAVEFGNELLSFLDTLPDESEQPTMGYDEAYLNEKIAKASKSWEGVDVDKFMDEVRGREPVSDCHDLTEAAIDFADYARKALYSKDYAISSIADYDHGCIDGFKAGAKWGANHLRDTTKKVSEDLEEAARECSKTIYNKPLSGNPQEGYIVYDPDKYDAFKAGAEWQKRKMMDEAYEEKVQEVYQDDDGIHCSVSVGTDYKPGTIVYVITIQKEGAEQ